MCPFSFADLPRLTLPELLKLKLPVKLGANFHNFGIFLLDDTIGTRVRAMELKHRGDGEAIVRDILCQWLEGRGISVSWSSLITTLKEIDQNVLARDIEMYIGVKNV